MVKSRDAKRIKRRLSLRFGLEKPEKRGFTEDIAYGGLFIKTANLYQPGTRIVVELTLPNETSVNLIGSVRWAKKVPPTLIRVAKKAGMGVKILNFINGKESFKQFLLEIENPSQKRLK